MSGFSGGFRAMYRDCQHEPKHDWESKKICIRLTMQDRKKNAKTRKRIRHVVPTGEIAHLWAHQVQDSARNGCRSMMFEGRTIFSWGHHFPMARIVEVGKRKVYLVTSRKSSSSTSGHMGSMRTAIPQAATIFEVKNVCKGGDTFSYGGYGSGRFGGGSFNTDEDPDAATHKSNVEDLVKTLTDQIAAAKRARSVWSKSYKTNAARDTRNNLVRYAEFFKLKLPELPEVPKMSGGLVRKMKAHEAQLEATRVERVQKQHARLFERWKAGESVQLPRVSWRNRDSTPVMLRVLGDEVETSMHVRVPITGPAGAARLWRFLTAMKVAGRTYKRNGHSEHIGNFTIDSFDGELLQAGCHRIQFSECERIAAEVLKVDSVVTA